MKKRNLLLALALFSLPLTAQQSWWPTTDGDTQEDDDNHAVVNIGQLKNMTAQAAAHFEAEGIAVPEEIVEMLADWRDAENQADNSLAANIGQLKNVSKPFWDKLVALQQRDSEDLPWTPDPADDDNLAITNIGQLKNVFNYDLSVLDSDEDGIPDAWEIEHFGNLAQDVSSDFDGDGVNDLEEYRLRSNPKDVIIDGIDTDNDGWLDSSELEAGGDPDRKDNPTVGLKVYVL